MLFETLLQPKIFILLFVLGFCSGFIYDVFAYIVFLCKNNKIVKLVMDFVATLLVFVCFYFCILHLDYGATRAYHILAFFSALLLERYLLGKLIAKLILWCYNIFIKFTKNILEKAQKIKWNKTKHKAP